MKKQLSKISNLECKIEEALPNTVEQFVIDIKFKGAEEIYKTLADTYNSNLNDIEKTRKFYNMAAELMEKNEHFSLAARYYEKAENLKRAIEMWEKSVERNIKYGFFSAAAEACEKLARIYERLLNDERKAREVWRRAGDLYMKGGFFYYAALSYKRAGDLEKAEESWKKEIEKLGEINNIILPFYTYQYLARGYISITKTIKKNSNDGGDSKSEN